MGDRRYWRNLAGVFIGAMSVGALAILVRFSYQFAMASVHPPRLARPADETPARYGISYREIRLTTSDGLELAGWYTPPENGAVILVAHGYAGTRSAEMHAFFARHGYGVVSWDFRAHGESQGTLSTLGFNETLDVQAALDFVLGQAGVEHIGAWGASMGAATAITAAADREEIEAVVADSAFPTLEEELTFAVPFPVMRPFTRHFAERETGLGVNAVRPIDHIGEISPRAVFLIQGASDPVIPPNSARRLFEAAGEPRRLWIGPDVGHVAMFSAMAEDYERKVIGFFDTTLLGIE